MLRSPLTFPGPAYASPPYRPSTPRVYSPDVQEVLTLVEHCRDFGFSIEETRALVSLSTSDDRDCVEARKIAQVHLNTVRAKLAELQNLERSLSKFVQACTDSAPAAPPRGARSSRTSAWKIPSWRRRRAAAARLPVA